MRPDGRQPFPGVGPGGDRRTDATNGPPLQPREGRSPRCQACSFDLSGLPCPDGTPLVCPECGAHVRLELAYSTPRERVTEWLQEPARPTPARLLLTSLIMIAAGATALLALLAAVYVVAIFVSGWAAGR